MSGDRDEVLGRVGFEKHRKRLFPDRALDTFTGAAPAPPGGHAMRMFRNDVSVSGDSFATAEAYYSEIRKGFREKANHNKHESNYVFFGIICFTLAAPLFVTMGEGWFFGKALPATLSVLAAGATSWLQIRKPQRLWSIYRRAQRELEREKTAFDFRLGDYEKEESRDKLLASRVSEIAFRVHEQWEGLVPEPDALVAQTPSNPLLKSDRANAG